MHQVYLHLFEFCLTTVPLTVEPKRILDIGCATGDWCLDMAEIYPDAEIIGTDSTFHPAYLLTSFHL